MSDTSVLQDQTELTEAFRHAMRSVASAVYLITGRGPDGDVGMTATAACSLSFDPMSVLISVNRGAAFTRTLETTGRFVLNVLSTFDEPVANAFGSQAGRDRRFVDGEWYDLNGISALRSSISSIFCEVAGTMEFGTHRIYAGSVQRVDNRSGRAELLYCNGSYRTLGA